jgi:biotin carboxyl carrier protein
VASGRPWRRRLKYYVTIGARTHEVELVEILGELHVRVNGEPFSISYEEADRLGQVVVLHEGLSYGMSIEGDIQNVGIGLAGHYYALSLEDERERAAHLSESSTSTAGGVVKSVMPGIVVDILVAPGELVTAGQTLLILEAMKMQNEIAAPFGGRVQTIHVECRQAVSAGQKLIVLGPG